MRTQKKGNKNFLFCEVKAQAPVHKLSNCSWPSNSRKQALRTLLIFSQNGKEDVCLLGLAANSMFVILLPQIPTFLLIQP